MRAHTHTHTYIAEVERLLVLRQPSNGGKSKRLVRILTERNNKNRFHSHEHLKLNVRSSFKC